MIKLALVLLIVISKADGKEDIRTTMEFERMKFRSNYPKDMDKVTKEGQLFILWISHIDYKEYANLKQKYPDAIHSYADCSKLHDCKPGIMIGIKNNGKIVQSGPVPQKVEVRPAQSPFSTTPDIIVPSAGKELLQNRGEGQLPVVTYTLAPMVTHGGITTSRC